MTNRLSDPEAKPAKPPRFGFSSLAAYVSEDKDKSLSIYRAFERLSSRNLLYLEAELLELEHQQDYFDDELLLADAHSQRWTRSWKHLVASGAHNPQAQQRVDLIMRIRQAMKEYRMCNFPQSIIVSKVYEKPAESDASDEALILEEAVLKMGRPHRRQIRALKYFSEQRYERPDRRAPILSGLSARRLDDEDDLIVLSKPVDQDWLIRFVRRYFHVFFLEPNQQLVGDLARISERRIAHAVSVAATIIAAGLLVGAITNLYFVTNNKSRLGLIGGYTAVFAISVAGLTNARRAELFASTAAYAAVLAVFVGGPLAVPTDGSLASGGVNSTSCGCG